MRSSQSSLRKPQQPLHDVDSRMRWRAWHGHCFSPAEADVSPDLPVSDVTHDDEATFNPRTTPMVIAVVVAAILLGNALLLLQRTHEASAEVARGQGVAFGFAAGNVVRQKQALLDKADLEKLVDEHREAGLRFIGEYSKDGALVAAVGEATGKTLAKGGVPSALEHLDDGRYRVSHPLPPVTPSQPREDRAIVAYEFVPETSVRLDTQGRLILIGSLLSALAVIGLAILLARASDARLRLARDVAKNRHLASLGEMSGVLAHQVKNPLQSLKGHAQLLVEQLTPGTPQANKAGVVVAEAVRLEKLVEELLRFLRAGTGALQREAVDVVSLVRELGGDVAGDAVVIDVDRVLFRQALGNVLHNAQQAGERAPELAVRREDGVVVVVVRDFGEGIPAEDLPRLFEPFFTRRAQGTGLGLTIARRVAELHGGSLSAANASEGGGAVFTFRVPERPQES